MAKPKGRIVRIVQNLLDDGEIIKYDTQHSVENGIWDGIHGKRFYLSEQAPIWQGRLCGEFGYNASTIAAGKVLAGTYAYPLDCDPATKLILKECEKIRKVIPKNEVSTSFKRAHW